MEHQITIIEAINSAMKSLDYAKKLIENQQPTATQSLVQPSAVPVHTTAEHQPQTKQRPFDLEVFVNRAKNENVRKFYNCTAVAGDRTKTGFSAIGSLSMAGCSKKIIIDLLSKYCDATGVEFSRFHSILNNIK